MRPTDADFRHALAAHGDRIARYRAGKFTDDEFRPIRLGYGLYYQLDHTSHMQRIKLPGGVMTTAQAECLADITDDYGRGVAHFTTRQDIQLHWIGFDDLMPMYERLHAVGITTRGACADTVRNVTGCYHAGTLANEPFDVTPYLWAVHEYFLFHPLNLTLPRKFKIAFSSCAADCVQGPVNDIAFFPKLRDGKPGFSVQAGGGLGSQPFLAVPVCDFVPVEDTLIAAEAIVRTHHRYGERKNRHKARLKYVAKKWGNEKFAAEIRKEMARIDAQMGASLRAECAEVAESVRLPGPNHGPSPLPAAGDEAFAHWARTNVVAQKQEGYFGIEVQLPLGDLTGAQLRALARLAQEHGASQLRATNDQNVYMPWVPGARVRQVYDALRELRLADPDALHISDVLSCPGADYCSLAVSRSMGVAAMIRNHLLAANGHVEKLGVFRIRISGCPNSCGQHHVGDIGLTGMQVKGPDGQETPHYSILVGGSVGELDNAVGQRLVGRYPEASVPNVIGALAEYYGAQRRDGERFPTFVNRVGTQVLSELAQKAAGL